MSTAKRFLLIILAIAAGQLTACTPVEPIEPAGPADDTPGQESSPQTPTPPVAEDTGILQGRVTFNPAQPGPTHKDAPTPELPPEVFAGRTVTIYLVGTETLVTETPVTETGTYEVNLPAGNYTLTITLFGIERAVDLPPEITVHADQTTILDIVIDPGWR